MTNIFIKMSLNDIIAALTEPRSSLGFIGSFFALFCANLTFEEVHKAVSLAGGLLGVMIALASLYIKAQEIIKNNIEIRKEQKNETE